MQNKLAYAFEKRMLTKIQWAWKRTHQSLFMSDCRIALIAASPARLKVNDLIMLYSLRQFQEGGSVLRVIFWPLRVVLSVLRD